mmetsp:Transcript_7990/g.15579  ORF Transcript_7990/g.15579 Transcript_7990/m.15579 type:complete len:203 (+) Transcript_7990:1680-2288(+)
MIETDRPSWYRPCLHTRQETKKQRKKLNATEKQKKRTRKKTGEDDTERKTYVESPTLGKEPEKNGEREEAGTKQTKEGNTLMKDRRVSDTAFARRFYLFLFLCRSFEPLLVLSPSPSALLPSSSLLSPSRSNPHGAKTLSRGLPHLVLLGHVVIRLRKRKLVAAVCLLAAAAAGSAPRVLLILLVVGLFVRGDLDVEGAGVA